MKKLFVFFFLFVIFWVPNVYALEFDITSDYVILYNLNDDNVLYELNSEKKAQIASLTKIMTTIVGIENAKDLNKEVVITKDIFRGIDDYTVVGFKIGDKVTIKDLLYGTMLPSGADAVNALAIDVGGSIDKFVELMNSKAKELGLSNTHFDNPIGMDSENNYSSAGDVAKLLKYCLKNDIFKEIFTARTYTIPSIHKEIKSTLIGYSRSYGLDVTDITGAKSGFTDGAGLCLASTATIDDVNYLLVTMNADTKVRSNAVRDSLEIYDYFSSNYGYQKIIKDGQKFKTIPVKWGKVKNYDVVSTGDVSLYLANVIRKNRIQYVYEGVNELNYQILKNIISQFGVLQEIIFDNSSHFEGKVWRVMEEYSIEHHKSSPYRPQANEAIEATNKNVNNILAKMVVTYKDWAEKLPFALWGYRTSICASTGATPYSLVYGSEVMLPIEVEL